MASLAATRTEQLSSIDSLQTPTNKEMLNRHSNTTMVGNPSTESPSGSRPYSSSDQPNDVELVTSHHKSSNRGCWSRFVNSELGRAFFGLIYFVVICIGMAFCNQFSDHRWVTTNYREIYLEDRGFDIFPAQKDITPANVFVMTSVIFTLVGVALICPTWTARIIAIRRVFWVVGTLSILRALTLSVTTMPTPKVDCVPATKRGFGPMLWIALQMIPGTVQACTDDIFSGHTVFMVTCAIQWRLYCRNRWITYFTYIYITVGLYFVVATRLHYTVDVVLAVFITYAVWSLYMATIDVVMEKEYFGIRRNHEKYIVFDDRWAEINEQEKQYENDLESGNLDEKEAVNGDTTAMAKSTTSGFATKKAQLQHRLNRIRGPGIGYDRGEYDRVAFVPMQYNVWLTGAIRWCDGLDLRMHQSEDGTPGSRWEELVVDHRSKQHSQSSSTDVQHFSPQKYEVNEIDLEAGQVRHGRDTTTPVMLGSIHVINHSEGSSTAAGTK
ncbi:hypothetical protein BX616_008616 [Lobosporangium transversale]|uniref:Sphingomyelin synthase-like domain-containing protein n=1 Tax=Lobosporangium transversale TaxID=64571 RepID=A0A1Y2H2M1_9FUNG|nr:hypothetical protein BCR41DRAFT_366508 [Lobosporangium transversale]KAF9914274.1 hypothetical protein BX616_008616 [Lobosporangium transversale]ORZ28785.1 hypothetical protein BCR41DRAFT_366508 [Lobosporangium transversale]|eukprot:XP_021886458.1 hypothetical protein BCR41DRAFT_366508 [Lobosporangium transversale]